MTHIITLDTHIIQPKETPIGSVIWMHGLGADYHDFDSLVPDLSQDGKLPLRFIFPNAPIRPVTINQQMPMRAWYDIYSLTDLNREDQTGIATSASAISKLIHDEIEKGIPANRIVIAGFSQGGAMALYTGMRQPQPLAGILGLSCYLPLFNAHSKDAHPVNKQTPIFIAHGTHDATLPFFAGKMAYDLVSQTHPNTEFREYAMQHEISPQEIQDIHAFLKRIFGDR
jgi:phospholipase/carboxylesterase